MRRIHGRDAHATPLPRDWDNFVQSANVYSNVSRNGFGFIGV